MRTRTTDSALVGFGFLRARISQVMTSPGIGVITEDAPLIEVEGAQELQVLLPKGPIEVVVTS